LLVLGGAGLIALGLLAGVVAEVAEQGLGVVVAAAHVALVALRLALVGVGWGAQVGRGGAAGAGAFAVGVDEALRRAGVRDGLALFLGVPLDQLGCALRVFLN